MRRNPRYLSLSEDEEEEVGYPLSQRVLAPLAHPKRRFYADEAIEERRPVKRARVDPMEADTEDEEQPEDDGGDAGAAASEAEAEEDDQEEKGAEDGKVLGAARPFRFSGRHFGLTYSQVGDADVKRAFAQLQELDQVDEIVISREEHKDGGFHFHVYGSFNKKRNIKNPRYWDLTIDGVVLHPNLKRLMGKAGVGLWKRYVCKGGAFLSSMSVDLSTHKNFEQRMKDYKAWKSYCANPLEKRFQDSKEAKQGIRLFGQVHPDITERKRNFWIWGPSEIGKTTHVVQALAEWSVFNRVNEKFPYEGYMGEEFILMDDKPEPKKEELIHMLNGAFPGRDTPVFGETRYQRFFLRSGSKIRYFILSNDPPSYSHHDWFASRFTVLNVSARFGDGHEAQWVVY